MSDVKAPSRIWLWPDSPDGWQPRWQTHAVITRAEREPIGVEYILLSAHQEEVAERIAQLEYTRGERDQNAGRVTELCEEVGGLRASAAALRDALERIGSLVDVSTISTNAHDWARTLTEIRNLSTTTLHNSKGGEDG